MGLILMPLMIMWLVASIYTLRMGYHLISTHPLLTFGLPVILLALVTMSAYLYLGLYAFKHQNQIWAFDIPMFFLAGKIALLIFTMAALGNYFYASKIQNIYLLAGMFIIMFTLSIGALVGAFYSEHFIEKHNIHVTY